MTTIGELNPDGTIKTQADECAISGAPVLGEHHAVQRITGTPFFFRYLSDYEHLLSDALRAELAALAGKSAEPQAIEAETPVKGRKGKSTGEDAQSENPIDANPV